MHYNNSTTILRIINLNLEEELEDCLQQQEETHNSGNQVGTMEGNSSSSSVNGGWAASAAAAAGSTPTVHDPCSIIRIPIIAGNKTPNLAAEEWVPPLSNETHLTVFSQVSIFLSPLFIFKFFSSVTHLLGWQ
ncbi:hypothetical protein NE237_024327 [Protea cynaroides]|uniref:Uncharacterized protein n=1 Tax=Protea cynaroides TaxID=273540 RepID=A0A9Q0HGM8_9MAGN|nr:hypothetical protein NE237_024327 [Protea cynaroides]